MNQNSSTKNMMLSTMHQNNNSKTDENIENLYTLKKVQSKVRDKIVHWIDFSSTFGTTF